MTVGRAWACSIPSGVKQISATLSAEITIRWKRAFEIGVREFICVSGILKRSAFDGQLAEIHFNWETFIASKNKSFHGFCGTFGSATVKEERGKNNFGFCAAKI